MTRINVDEQVLKDALQKIETLQKRLAAYEEAPLAQAIEKALASPIVAGRDNVVGTVDMHTVQTAMNDGIFRPEKAKPITKAARAKAEKQTRTEIRKAREKSIGLRPSKYDS